MAPINARFQISEHTNRVLGVIKEKYGLKDKGKALDKFADIFGDEFVEREPKERVVRDIINSAETHIRKYGFKKMTKKEFDKLFELT